MTISEMHCWLEGRPFEPFRNRCVVTKILIARFVMGTAEYGDDPGKLNGDAHTPPTPLLLLLSRFKAILLLLLPWRLPFETSVAVLSRFEARSTQWIKWMLILIKIRSERGRQSMRAAVTVHTQPIESAAPTLSLKSSKRRVSSS
jgi:hypothetical protein